MKSIHTSLIVRLATVMVVLSVVSGGSLIAWLTNTLRDEFDRSLLVRAHALQSLITQEPDGGLDVDIDFQALGEFTGATPTDYFLFEDSQGKRVAASSDAIVAAPAGVPTAPWDTMLRHGVPARAMRFDFQPAVDREHPEAPVFPAAKLRMTIARDVRPLNALLARLRLVIGLATAFLSAAVVLAAVSVVRRGLAPLRGLAMDVASVKVTQADQPLDQSSRPSELRPIVHRINELLGRVTQALRRERQFTAALSHELRTPIAELRLMTELARRDPDNHPLAGRALEQGHDIALQMQTMVTTLLTIAGHENVAEPLPLSMVALADFVDSACARHEPVLTRRGVTVARDVTTGLHAPANPAVLSAVFDNLLSNAARYAKSRTAIEIAATLTAGRVELSFANEHDDLYRDDMSLVFDPFWRKNSARSDGQHVGLGLTLVRAYCAAMHARVGARLRENGQFDITIQFAETIPANAGGRA